MPSDYLHHLPYSYLPHEHERITHAAAAAIIIDIKRENGRYRSTRLAGGLPRISY